MAQPTSSLTRFIGPIYVGSSPPTAAIIGKPLEAGMVYFDIESGTAFCVYDGANWDCVAMTTDPSTATSTSTTTSTTTTTTTSTSTTTSTT